MNSVFSGPQFFYLIIAFVVLVIQALFFGVPFAGFGTLACLMTLLFGLLFIVLGVISEYLAMVFTETRNRPLYVVRKEIGRGGTGRASR